MDEKLEELLEDIYTFEEEQNIKSEKLFLSFNEEKKNIFTKLHELNLAIIKDSKIELTTEGKTKAKEIVRRHRLAEQLLHQVLEISDNQSEDTACKFEHILSEEVTNSICAFLGHPKFCPHGKPIPVGDCCKLFTKSLEPLVCPLYLLEAKENAKIIYILPETKQQLQKLSSYGLIPGSTITLLQKKPVLLIKINESQIALDPSFGNEIFVRKVK